MSSTLPFWVGLAAVAALVALVAYGVLAVRGWSKSNRCAGRRVAHLLQVRTRVLNGDLANDFRRWYPAFTPAADLQEQVA